MFCGWQPVTVDEVSRSGRLSSVWFSVWDLLGIGRGILSGRKATEVVPNLRDSAAGSMENAEYRNYVLNAVDQVKKTQADTYFYYLHSFKCQSCGTATPLHNPFVSTCSNCKTKVRMPPPLRLLNCLARVSIHFQQHFGDEQSETADLFIRYLVSLQSKLYEDQETPSQAERKQALELMRRLGKFQVKGNIGSIDMSNPEKIIFKYDPGTVEPQQSDMIALVDFTSTLQVAADWMFQTKALCYYLAAASLSRKSTSVMSTRIESTS